ncbi:MAG TPA: hypothetical protein VHC96_19190 [Puia sp.]|jgi:hypothetical protein|nr:hypothetical protein [Puia sp.]
MKKLRSFTILSGLLLLATSTTHAQSFVKAVSARTGNPAMIKYVGTQDDQVIFNISYANPQGAFFTLLVRDQDGSELYQHGFHDRNFSKQFRLPRTDKSKLSFVIRSGKDIEIVKSFGIDTRVIEDVVVTQLK